MSGIFGVCGPALREAPATVLARMDPLVCLEPHHRAEQRVTGPFAVGVQYLESQSETWFAEDPERGLLLACTGQLFSGHGGPAGSERGPAGVALDGYRTMGVRGLTSLDGEFLVCAWDARAGILTIVNDRFGLYPLYHASGPWGLAFAPTIRPLRVIRPVPTRPDQQAIAQYLRFQQLLGSRTWLEDVRLLPPASVLRFDSASGVVSIDRYWDWRHVPEERTSTFGGAVSECVAVFQRAVDRRLAHSSRPGVFLSGGLDGRTILAFIDRPITTLTFGTPGCRDVVVAGRVATQVRSDHHWFPLLDGTWVSEHAARHLALTEAMHSWIHCHGISMLAPARELVDTNLSGWDGGTILGGSLNFYDDDAFRQAGSESALTDAFYRGLCSQFSWPGLTDEESNRLLRGPAGRHLRGEARATMTEELASTSGFPRSLRADAFYIEQVLRRSLHPQVVMARSAIDVWCPYFDYELIDFLYSLPLSIRTSPRFRRAVLAARRPALARIPYERTQEIPHPDARLVRLYSIVQRGLNWLGRRGLPVGLPDNRLYADYETYLRHELRAWAEHLLFHERTLSRGLYDVDALRGLWQRHQSGSELHTIGKIVPVMAVEMAQRLLVDGDTPEVACGLDEGSRVLWDRARSPAPLPSAAPAPASV